MQLKHWGARLALGVLLFASALACRTADVLVAQQPTAVSTRTPHPTFTPLPPDTDTPVPTVPPPPTETTAPAVPTKRATSRPVARATPKPPPTAIPKPAAPAPTPAPSYAYATTNLSCEHAGNQYIKGKVYDSSDPSANGVPGLMMAMGGAGGDRYGNPIPNFDDGTYTFTLTAPGQGAGNGTYYIWIVDGSGNRISDMGGPININNKGADVPGSCWAGHVDFWRR